MLSKLGMLNRRQIQTLCNTHGKRRTNYILQNLSPYIDHLEHPYGRIYKLNQKGINLIGEGKLLKWGNVNHRLLRNDAYIYYRPSEWQAEVEMEYRNIMITPDAFFKSGMTYKFLEVDITQQWYKNLEKLSNYAKMRDVGIFQKQYGHFPLLVWVVEIESRVNKIKNECARLNLPCEVFTSSQIKDISERVEGIRISI